MAQQFIDRCSFFALVQFAICTGATFLHHFLFLVSILLNSIYTGAFTIKCAGLSLFAVTLKYWCNFFAPVQFVKVALVQCIPLYRGDTICTTLKSVYPGYQSFASEI